MNTYNSKRLNFSLSITILLFISLCLRLFYLWEYSSSIFFSVAIGPDVSEYYAWSQDILSGEPWSKVHIHAPLYPFFLAFTSWFSSGNFFIIRGVQLFIGLLSLLVTTLSVKKAFSEQTALCTACLWTFFTPILFYESALLSEGLLIFILSLASFFFLNLTTLLSRKNPDIDKIVVWSILSGLLYGLATVTHPLSIGVGILACFYLVYLCIKKKRIRKRIILCIIFMFTLFSIPIIWASYHTSKTAGEFVFIQGNAGMNIYLGNNSKANGTAYLSPGRDYELLSSEPYRLGGAKSLSSAKDYFLEKTKNYIFSSPFSYLLLVTKKFLMTWTSNGSSSGIDIPTLMRENLLIRYALFPFCLLSITAFIGIVGCLQKKLIKNSIPFLIIVVSYSLILSMTVFSDRYRLPMLIGFFVFGGYALSSFYTYLSFQVSPNTSLSDMLFKSKNGIFITLLFILFFILNITLLKTNSKSETVSLLSLKGEAYLKKRDFVTSSQYFNKVIESNPAWYRAYNRLGNALMNIDGSESKAKKVFLKALELNPYSINALLNLGIIESKNGKVKKAQESFQKILEIETDNAKALYNMGLIFEKKGEVNSAKNYYKRAIKKSPTFVSAYLNYGVLLQKENNFKSAEKLYKLAIKLAPKKVQIYTNLACLYATNNQNDKAKKFFEKSLHIDPYQEKIWLVYANFIGSEYSEELKSKVLDDASKYIKLYQNEDKNTGDKLMLFLFSTSTCNECKELQKNILPNILKVFSDSVQLKFIPIDETKNFELLLKYEKEYKNDSSDSVKLFIGKKCLSGFDDIVENIEKTIQEELILENKTFIPNKLTEVKKPQLKNIALSIIWIAGLADGINPCAFVTLVFLISVLSTLKKSKSEILLIGICFSISVFFTYFLLGFGVFQIIKIFSVKSGIAGILNYLVGFFTLSLAILSFWDYLNLLRNGKKADIRIKLPKKIRFYINRLIHTNMKKQHLVYSSIFLGIIISILESACTGQLYLPTITYIVKTEGLSSSVIFYLFLYNIAFIMPLLVVFGITYYGVQSKRLTEVFNKNIATSKLIMSIIFAILAFLLIFKP